MLTNSTSAWPEPPYYAAILSTWHTGEDLEGYAETAVQMVQAAESQPGYLGRESLEGPDGHELTVVYYTTDEAIRRWREIAEHLVAQRLGRERWYEAYEVRIARVERSYRFQRRRALN
ncbi:antibiotic biosynthesis monooxygenase [Micromonospora sp. NPDC047707]|uniref:antibiotic biosynthesis monooxygenase family protein n=1 Tax=Micromonospora sp. NPDC047707 TaxID=3154498 RepID=UPI003452A153